MKDQAIVSKPQRTRKKIKADTIISVVLDMSGSMSHLAAATREGLNTYLNEQREGDDKVLVNVTVFDSEYDWNHAREHKPRINTIFNLTPIEDVPQITAEHYRPDGGTPLYDAIGVVVERTEEALDGVRGNPDVLLVIITDGDNNTSTRFTREDIKALIEKKQGQGWTPVYLGANQDAWSVSEGLGIARGSAKTYSANVAGVRDQVFKDLGTRTHAHRMSKKAFYESHDAGERGLVGSYHTTDFFAGEDGNLEDIVAGMTASASLGGEDDKKDEDES